MIFSIDRLSLAAPASAGVPGIEFGDVTRLRHVIRDIRTVTNAESGTLRCPDQNEHLDVHETSEQAVRLVSHLAYPGSSP